MFVSFDNLHVGNSYSRKQLAKTWGYSSYQAIARGVVTPRDDNKIILFVTEEKQISAEQYQDKLGDEHLHWEGPNHHFAEDRIIKASQTGDEIHLFYRRRHHSDFIYYGKVWLVTCQKNTNCPSSFVFKIK
jgi:hypothetical protein